MGYVSRGRESCSVTVHDYALTYLPLRRKQCRPALFSFSIAGTLSDQREPLGSPGGPPAPRGCLSRQVLSVEGLRGGGVKQNRNIHTLRPGELR